MIKLRDLKEADVPFVMDTLIRSYSNVKTGITGERPVKDSIATFYNKHLGRLYEQGAIICTVACSAEDDDLIFGYAIFGLDRTLHYVYVKGPFRKMGIATKLIRHMVRDRSDLVVSHWTRGGCDILRKKFKLTYNPYKFYQ